MSSISPSSNAAPKVHVIVINWNGEEDTRRCLSTLMNVDYPNMHVVISDNGSRPTSLEALHEWSWQNDVSLNDERTKGAAAAGIRSFTIIENGRNLGFTGANTAGIEHALAHGSDYVLFLNNDTLVTPKFLSLMVDVAEKDPAIGLLGCKTFLGDGTPADAPKIIWSLGGYAYHFGNPMNRGSNQPDRPEWNGVVENELICGCCMLIRRAAIEQCGVQDDEIFFAIDDVEYSVRVAKGGWKNVLVLDAEIHHAGSRSVEGRAGLQLYYLFRNTYFFRRKYFPWYRNIVFFTHHLTRYLVIGGLGRLMLGRGRANVGMLLGAWDFFIGRMGECPHPQLLKRKAAG